MTDNNKKYEMGGALQSFSSPMLAQGMQGGLSGFGTSGVGMFADGGQVSDIERILAKYRAMTSNNPKQDKTSEFLNKSWEGKNLDDYIMYSDQYKRGGKMAKGGQIASIGDSGIITDKNSMFVGKMATITVDLGNMYEVRVGERTTIVKKNGINIVSDQYANGGKVNKYEEIFDKLEIGDGVVLKFDSNVNGGKDLKLTVKSKKLVGKGKPFEAEQITFAISNNPTGKNFYAHKRKNGYVAFGYLGSGEMEVKDILVEKKYADGGEVNKYEATFDELKKGDVVTLKFGSSISRENDIKLIVKSKNLVGKGKTYESEKITFAQANNPSGVKFYAYKRKNGYVGFASGDMAISVEDIVIENKYARGGTSPSLNNGEINGRYLDGLSEIKQRRILMNVANHYNISLEEANDELRDEEAELLYEYITDDNTLKMSIYYQFEDNKNKFAKGGKVIGDSLEEVARQAKQMSNNWKKNTYVLETLNIIPSTGTTYLTYTWGDDEDVNHTKTISHDIDGLKSIKIVSHYAYGDLVSSKKEVIYKNNSYAKGGEVSKNFRGVDLFEDYEMQEPKLQKIVQEINDAYEEDEISTQFLQDRLDDAEAIGYTFEIDMDGSAYGLRPIGVEITELEGFEEGDYYAEGGDVDESMDVQFIEYNGDEIMYEPIMKKYYANDVEFDTLQEAQRFLDSGEMSDSIRGAYARGLYEKGGEIDPNALTIDKIVGTKIPISVGSQSFSSYDGWTKDEVIDLVGRAVKHNLIDTEFYYNYLSSEYKKEYLQIWNEEIYTKMMKNINNVLAKYFQIATGSMSHWGLQWNLNSRVTDQLIDNFFRYSKKLPQKVKDEYAFYRNDYAGVDINKPLLKQANEWVNTAIEKYNTFGKQYLNKSIYDVPNDYYNQKQGWIDRIEIDKKYKKKQILAKGGEVSSKIYEVEYEMGGKKYTSEYMMYDWERIENKFPPETKIISIKEKHAQGGEFEDEEEEMDYNKLSDVQEELGRLYRWKNQYGSKGADGKIKQLEERVEYLKKNDTNSTNRKMAQGGKIGFEKLAKKVAKRYVGKKVSKEYQTEYGKTYDAKEAKDVGNKVAGKVYKQQVAKKKIVRKLQRKTK